MFNSISAEQAYVNELMSNLPEVKDKKEYTLKKGESLWKIAKRELAAQNPTNEEIRDYMLLIAKLNNLTSTEKMNALKVNETIYLPGKSNQTTQPPAPYKKEIGWIKTDFTSFKPDTTIALSRKAPIEIKPVEPDKTEPADVKERTDVQKTVDKLITDLKTNKTLYLKRMHVPNDVAYWVMGRKEHSSGFISQQHPYAGFTLDKNGEITKLTFEGINDLWRYGNDYDVHSNGDVIFRKTPDKVHEKLSKEDKEKLFNEFNRIYQELEIKKY